MSFIKVVKVIMYSASLVSMILSFIRPTILFVIFGSLAVILINVAIHELGHVVACLITRTRINYVEIMCFKIQNKRIAISSKLSFYGRVNFVTSKYRKSIYLSGIITSMLLTIVSRSCLASIYC